MHWSEHSTNDSRRAEQAGTLDTVFNIQTTVSRGSWYKIMFTGKNGANLTTDVWSSVFSYDDTAPYDGLATLCPPTGALRLDLRGTSGCGLGPNPPWDTTDLHQASTSLLKVHAGAHPTPLHLPCKQSPIYRAAHRRHPSLSVAHSRVQVRWKGFVDPESQVVLCELRVIDQADQTEVAHEGNLPCDGTKQRFEMTALSLQHRHAIWLK